MKALRTILFLALLASPALAQDSVTLSWKTQTFKSSKLGESRTIYIATPPDYAREKQRYPVLVLLDADDRSQFAAAVANVGFLTSRAAIPAMLIVGIPNGKDRTRDLTPVATGMTAQTFATAGGAAKFTDFLIDEVLPRVRSRYRTLPATVLAGHSFGGLFALHVAATKPGTFAGIIAMSPSLWWNDSTGVIGYADSIAKSSVAQRLFATSGGKEPPIDVTTRRFVARLDSVKPASLAFASQRYPDDTHGLTPAPSLVDGLRFVFAPVAINGTAIASLGPTSDSAAVVSAVLSSEQSYAGAAHSLGLPEKLPEDVLNSLGYNVLQTLKLPNVAVWVFERNVDHYPDSPNVYDSLGDGLLARGDSTAARTEFKRARDVAVRVGQPVSKETLKKLAALEPKANVVQAGKPRKKGPRA